MAYLFLSYTKSDRDSAFAIRTVLQREGFQVWMDDNPYELSERHWPIVAENIRHADGFVLLVSDAVKKSNWVKRELDFAEEIQKPIFPILVQGEGWSRLKMNAAKLGLGLKLDMPDDFVFRIQDETHSQMPLPPQIPSKTIDKPKLKEKKPFPIRSAMFAAIFALFALMILSFFITWLNNQNQAEARRQNYANATASQEMAFDFTSTQARVTAEARETESQIAVEMQYARATEVRRATLAVTTTREAHLNLTAVLGNGQLPCDSRLIAEEGHFNLYRRPSNDSSPSILSLAEGETRYFIVREWIVNDDGVWYRVGTAAQHLIGYLRAENLQLAENCPR